MQHRPRSGYRKYGYKIVSPASHKEVNRALPPPVKLSPRFSLDIDFASEQKVADISSNKIDTAEKIPFTPFVFPVPKPKSQDVCGEGKKGRYT